MDCLTARGSLDAEEVKPSENSLRGTQKFPSFLLKQNLENSREGTPKFLGGNRSQSSTDGTLHFPLHEHSLQLLDACAAVIPSYYANTHFRIHDLRLRRSKWTGAQTARHTPTRTATVSGRDGYFNNGGVNADADGVDFKRRKSL